MKRQFFIQQRLPLAVALTTGLFSFLQRLVGFTSTEWLNLGYAFVHNFTFSLLIWWLTDWLGKHFSRLQKVVLVYVIGFLLMSIVAYTVNQLSQQAILPIQPPGFRNQSPQAGVGNYLLQLQLLRSFTLITAILLIHYTVELFSEKQRMQLENERLKQENLNAQLEAIRQQINPHFFFNTLNTLKTLVKNNQPEALPYIMQLSNVFRYLLRLQQQTWVTLDEELQFLKAYQFLLEIRFADALRIEIEVPDALLSTPIPPATLQLLVENAVKHNVVSLTRPLHIRIRHQPPDALWVENNLQLKRTPEPSGQFGLHSLNNRYAYLGGQGIQVEQTDDRFRVILPLITRESTHENAHY
ncbi:sensor histidine kinase [Larkinella sp. VNQ87]|uniref:sensor histidine kinase n=1 Tax=Larkinella sp. VNQ87 TaxID=3400921 RepID=UPI003C0B7944